MCININISWYSQSHHRLGTSLFWVTWWWWLFFFYWCCRLYVWQAETCHCKTCVSRALSGLTRGFESHLLGIIGVCFTVAVTHMVARCEVDRWGKNNWGRRLWVINKQVCLSANITFSLSFLSFTSVSHLYAYSVGVQCLWCLHVCVLQTSGWAPCSDASCNYTIKRACRSFWAHSTQHTALLSPGGHTSYEISIAVSPENKTCEETDAKMERGGPCDVVKKKSCKLHRLAACPKKKNKETHMLTDISRVNTFVTV